MREYINLFEFKWQDSSVVAKILKKHEDDDTIFVHFTDVPKLGVNPQKEHSDPHGVYFYPARWLLTNAQWDQYALTNAYFFVVKLIGGKGINLTQASLNELGKVAHANGWGNDWDACLESDETFHSYTKGGPMEDYNLKTPGGRFWAIADAIANHPPHGVQQRPWNALLKGVDWIRDEGFGVINENEPAQLLVLNPRNSIKIVDMNENRNDNGKLINDLIKIVEKELGAKAKFLGRDEDVGSDEKAVKMEISDGIITVVVNRYSGWMAVATFTFYVGEPNKQGYRKSTRLSVQGDSNYVDFANDIRQTIAKFRREIDEENISTISLIYKDALAEACDAVGGEVTEENWGKDNFHCDLSSDRRVTLVQDYSGFWLKVIDETGSKIREERLPDDPRGSYDHKTLVDTFTKFFTKLTQN